MDWVLRSNAAASLRWSAPQDRGGGIYHMLYNIYTYIFIHIYIYIYSTCYIYIIYDIYSWYIILSYINHLIWYGWYLLWYTAVRYTLVGGSRRHKSFYKPRILLWPSSPSKSTLLRLLFRFYDPKVRIFLCFSFISQYVLVSLTLLERFSHLCWAWYSRHYCWLGGGVWHRIIDSHFTPSPFPILMLG